MYLTLSSSSVAVSSHGSLAIRGSIKNLFKYMSGFVSINRYSFKMTISERDILRTLIKSRDRIAAAAWVVVRDAHAAEDIFQSIVLKALMKEVSFEAEGAMFSRPVVRYR